MVSALKRAVPVPQHEIVVHRAPGRRVLGQRAPLAAGLQHIENPVHHLAKVHIARPTAALGRRDQGRDQRPLRSAQVARIASAPGARNDMVARLQATLVFRDELALEIEQRERMEEALRESETRIRLKTDNLPVLISHVDSDQRYRFVGGGA